MFDKPKFDSFLLKNNNVWHVHIVNGPKIRIFFIESANEKLFSYNKVDNEEDN